MWRCSTKTVKFFDGRRFSAIKPGAFFINTSRGAIVDEEALYDALSEGSLAGAGLDVFATEPYEPARADKDLRKLDNVVLTPHVSSNTAEANERMGRACLGNIVNFFAGNLRELSRVDTGD